MDTLTQAVPATASTLDQVATAAFNAQVAANPRADEVEWYRCEEAARTLGFDIEDVEDDLEQMVDRLWRDHKANPTPKGERKPYAKDGSNGIPGWFAICDHQGYYMNVQFEERSDAELYSYWRTRELDEDEGSYCPALIEADGGTRCDI